MFRIFTQLAGVYRTFWMYGMIQNPVQNLAYYIRATSDGIPEIQQMLYYLKCISLASRRFCRITSSFSLGSCSLSWGSCSLSWGSCSLSWGSCSLNWGSSSLSSGSCSLSLGSCSLSFGRCSLRCGSCSLSCGSCRLSCGSCRLSCGSCSLSCGSCRLSCGSCNLRWGSCSLSWSGMDSFLWGCCRSRGSLTAVDYVSQQLPQNTALKRLLCCKSFIILNKKINMTPCIGNRTNLRHLSHEKHACSDGNS